MTISNHQHHHASPPKTDVSDVLFIYQLFQQKTSREKEIEWHRERERERKKVKTRKQSVAVDREKNIFQG